MRDENQAEVARTRKGVPAGVLAAMLLSGCLAQQADLVETKIDLDNKIEKLNKKEREIQIQVDQANTSIIDQEKKVNDLVSETRARLRSEISELRDDSLPRIQGTLDELSKRLGDLRKALEDRDVRVDQLLAKRDADSEKRFAALGTAQKADRDHLYEELVKLGASLDETNKSVVEVTKRLDVRLQEHDRELGRGTRRPVG
jgi:gas vesicle protein